MTFVACPSCSGCVYNEVTGQTECTECDMGYVCHEETADCRGAHICTACCACDACCTCCACRACCACCACCVCCRTAY